MNKEYINSSIKYWHDFLVEKYGENHILNITLYGSQNYNLDTPNSDVDVKAIYIPSVEEAVLEKQRISTEFHNDKNEHCELKDIREMCLMYKKQNINFLETLFTEYRWDNPNYFYINKSLKERAEDIANYNRNRMINSICGQAFNAIMELEKKFGNLPMYSSQELKDLEKHQLKTLAKIFYFNYFLDHFISQNKTFKESLQVNNFDMIMGHPAQDFLIDLKSNNLKNNECYFSALLKELKLIFSLFEAIGMQNNYMDKEKMNKIDIFLKQLCLDTIFQGDKL